VGLPGGLKQAPPLQSGPDISLPKGRTKLHPIPPSEQVSSSDQAELEPKVDEGGWDNTSVDLPGFGFKWGDTGAKDSKTNQDAKDKPFFAWF
jgi:hypothetical protein